MNEWIGRSEDPTFGLAWFTHDQLTEFLLRDCSLADTHPGVECAEGVSKRDRLVATLNHAERRDLVTILENLLDRAELTPPPGHTPDREWRIRSWVTELTDDRIQFEGPPGSAPLSARVALKAVDAHVGNGEYPLAVDRIHTALHALIKHLANETGLDTSIKRELGEQFAAVRQHHPAFTVRQGDRTTANFFKRLGALLDALNQLRNEKSLAHPTPDLLDHPEARLAVETGMALLRYIIDRAEGHARGCISSDVSGMEDLNDLPFE